MLHISARCHSFLSWIVALVVLFPWETAAAAGQQGEWIPVMVYIYARSNSIRTRTSQVFILLVSLLDLISLVGRCLDICAAFYYCHQWPELYVLPLRHHGIYFLGLETPGITDLESHLFHRSTLCSAVNFLLVAEYSLDLDFAWLIGTHGAASLLWKTDNQF